MSVYGIRPSLPGTVTGPNTTRTTPQPRVERQPQAPNGPTTTAPATRPAAAPATNAAGALPDQAPPGTDPDLWAVLTQEERKIGRASCRERGAVRVGAV